MKTTVLTVGANDGRSLHTTYSSLLRQKRADWEWLIGVPTGATVRILDEILSVGGSRPALESFKAFRGREPSLDALLRHQGMA